MNKARHIPLMLFCGIMLVATGCGAESGSSLDENIGNAQENSIINKKGKFAKDDDKFMRDFVICMRGCTDCNCKALAEKQLYSQYDHFQTKIFGNKDYPRINFKTISMKTRFKIKENSRGARCVTKISGLINEKGTRRRLFNEVHRWVTSDYNCKNREPALFFCGEGGKGEDGKGKFSHGAKLEPLNPRRCAVELCSKAAARGL